MLETHRLRLRRLRPSDEADLVALDNEPEVMRYVGSPRGTPPPEETLDRVRQRIGADHGPYGWWLVEGKDDGLFHGLGLLLPVPESDDVEIGYRLARRSWGKGIATEAVAALIGYAFRSLGLPRVVAVVYPENVASRRVLEKLGFAYDGLCDYKDVRVPRYALSAEAWRPR